MSPSRADKTQNTCSWFPVLDSGSSVNEPNCWIKIQFEFNVDLVKYRLLAQIIKVLVVVISCSMEKIEKHIRQESD